MIGICGYGFVGQSVHSIMNIDPIINDIKQGNFIKHTEAVLETEIVFICLPTPFENGEFNFSIIKQKLDFFVECNYKGVIVIKSTCLSSYLDDYKSLNIVVNPEFLNQNTSFDDSLNQKVIILGGDYNNVKKVIDFYKRYTILKNPEFEIMSIKEACDFKYTRNLYGAFKVLFWEFIQDTTGNSRKMAELYNKMPYQSEMSQVGMDGFRGYGGACFPKDVEAFNQEHEHLLTKFMIKYNKKLGD